MAIKHTATPVGAIEALQEGLQHAISNNAPAARSLISSPGAESQFVSGTPKATQNEVAPSFPVFTIDPQDIAEGRLLDAAKLRGWRFLILQADSATLAATVIESDGFIIGVLDIGIRTNKK